MYVKAKAWRHTKKLHISGNEGIREGFLKNCFFLKHFNLLKGNDKWFLHDGSQLSGSNLNEYKKPIIQDLIKHASAVDF